MPVKREFRRERNRGGVSMPVKRDFTGEREPRRRLDACEA